MKKAFDAIMSKYLRPSTGNPGIFLVNTLGFDRLDIVEIPLSDANRFDIIEMQDMDSFVDVNLKQDVPFLQISGDKGLALGIITSRIHNDF